MSDTTHTTRINNVPVYSTDELDDRIGDGSVDVNRLAATVHSLQTTVTAMANWINDRIQHDAAANEATPPNKKRG